MAYMSQERKKELAPKIKDVLKKYKVKGTISVDHHAILVVNIKSSSMFKDVDGDNRTIHHVYIDENYTGQEAKFLKELHAAMSKGNHDNSDAMTDYFDVGWYTEIRIGKWDSPYTCTDRPTPGKQYALTGDGDDKCIMNGNTWAESVVKN